MKKLCYFLILVICVSCATVNGPNMKKHSYDTKAGKKKLQKYNDLYNGADKQYDYRIQKTKKANKKAGYKAKKY